MSQITALLAGGTRTVSNLTAGMSRNIEHSQVAEHYADVRRDRRVLYALLWQHLWDTGLGEERTAEKWAWLLPLVRSSANVFLKGQTGSNLQAESHCQCPQLHLEAASELTGRKVTVSKTWLTEVGDGPDLACDSEFAESLPLQECIKICMNKNTHLGLPEETPEGYGNI